jgi:hypothetical protein
VSAGVPPSQQEWWLNAQSFALGLLACLSKSDELDLASRLPDCLLALILAGEGKRRPSCTNDPIFLGGD